MAFAQNSACMMELWLRLVLFALPCLAVTLYIGRPLRWFTLHPLLMTLAFVAAAGSGIQMKRKGGRANTVAHGYLMLLAFVLALGGWYVIYQQKNMLGKSHNTSWHSYQGLLTMGGYAVGAVGGLAALHPDFGLYKTNKNLRLAHKTLSRTATLAALAALGSGYSKLGDAVTTAIVALALAALAISLSLVECLLGPAGSKQTGESARFLLPT